MDEKIVERIFAGNLTNLPMVSSKIVRIFTSSTFTDMLMERNTLMEYVYPKIKEYCRERHGLEFQVSKRSIRWKKVLFIYFVKQDLQIHLKYYQFTRIM